VAQSSVALQGIMKFIKNIIILNILLIFNFIKIVMGEKQLVSWRFNFES
jgi:hypothetical protein